jgi:single-strand DNA-binding protein
MNDVTLIGNLVDDPKYGTTSGGVSKCTFRLATQREYTNPQTGQREADFHNIVTWRQLADLCAKYLVKGRQCAIKGSIQYRSYDAQDGSKRYITEILADKVKFLGGGNRQQTGGYQAAPGGYAQLGEFVQVDDDELPF